MNLNAHYLRIFFIFLGTYFIIFFSINYYTDLINTQQDQTSSNHPKMPSAAIMIIPGNGASDITQEWQTIGLSGSKKWSSWYCWLGKKLENFTKINGEQHEITVICETMPDYDEAKEVIWVPFIKSKVGSNENKKFDKIYVIGHSSGAVCIMRLLETLKLTKAFLVSPCTSDLGEPSETISGYYPQQPNSNVLRPWEWSKMKENCEYFSVLGSTDDPFIPIEEMRVIKKEMGLVDGESYFEYKDRGHFMVGKSRDILKVVVDKIGLE